MFITILLSACAVSLGQSVSSYSSDDIYVSRHRVHRPARQSYQYNHPPTFEDFQPIPVAVFYDEEAVREEKALRETNEGNKLLKAPFFDTTTSSSSKGDERKRTQTKKPENEQQIPVIVVYDEEPKITVNKKVKPREQSKRNSQRVTTAKPGVTKYSENQKESGSNGEKSRRRQRPIVPIIGSENHVYAHTGEFNYSYEGGDGTRAFETGRLKSYEDEKSGEAVKGGFSYTDKDGKDFSLSYTADEKGYRPTGAHLPTPPPIPPAIARALAYLATKITPETATESFSGSN